MFEIACIIASIKGYTIIVYTQQIDIRYNMMTKYNTSVKYTAHVCNHEKNVYNIQKK